MTRSAADDQFDIQAHRDWLRIFFYHGHDPRRKPGLILENKQDWSSEIDMRKLTLAEITLLGTYTYTMADMYATVNALHNGTFGDLSWVETRSLDEGVTAFTELDRGNIASGKVVLLPH
ncbi:MAG: hypothetical protein ACTIKR_18795 [Advenella sp.]|uniref:hypothetical protein n=1 Tax=Advenella sp. TaxID=1872388 RepID=UPI00268C73FF